MSASSPQNQETAHRRLEQRIAQTQSAVRRADFLSTVTALLTLSGLVLLIGVLLDHLTTGGLSHRGRWTVEITALAVLLIYFLRRLFPIVTRKINPFYAADLLEKNSPELKNGLINWLGLRRLPGFPRSRIEGAVLDSLARETEEKVAQIPIETVVDERPVLRWGIALVVVIALLAIYSIFSPKSLFTSTARILLPFAEIQAPQSLRFISIDPGNLTLYQGKEVPIRAEISGGGHDQVMFVWETLDRRLTEQEIPMSETRRNLFEAVFPAEEGGVSESIRYYLRAGHGRSESRSDVYTITVRPPLTFEVEQLQFHYPAYTGWKEETREGSGEIRAPEGTEVRITGKGSEPLSQAFLVPDFALSGARTMTVRSDDPYRADCSLLLKSIQTSNGRKQEISSYRLLGADSEGLRSLSEPENPTSLPPGWKIEFLQDTPPQIQWSDDRPTQEEHPLNDHWTVSVKASDTDISLRRVELHFQRAEKQGDDQLKNEPPLPVIDLLLPVISEGATPYTGEQNLSGTISPLKLGLEKKDIGTVIEYYAEAFDSLLPLPNSTRTPLRSFTLQPIDLNLPEESSQPEKQDENQEGESSGEENGSENGEASDDSEGNESQSSKPDEGKEDDSKDPGKSPEQDGGSQEGGNSGGASEKPDEGENSSSEGSDTDSSEGEGAEGGEGEASSGEGLEQNNGESGADSSEGESSDPNGEKGEGTGNNPENSSGKDSSSGGSEEGLSPDHSEEPSGEGKSGENGAPSNEESPDNNSSQGENSGHSEGEASSEPVDPKSDPGEVFEKILDHFAQTQGTDALPDPNAPDVPVPGSGNSDSDSYREDPLDDPNAFPDSGSAPDNAPRISDPNGGKVPEGADRNQGEVNPDSHNYMATEGEGSSNLQVPSDANVTNDPDHPAAGSPTNDPTGAKDSESVNPNGSPEGAIPSQSGQKGESTPGVPSQSNQGENPGKTDPSGNGESGNDALSGVNSSEGTPSGNSADDSSSPQGDLGSNASQNNPNQDPSTQSGRQGSGGAMAMGELESGPAAGRADAAHLKYTEKATSLALTHLEDQIKEGIDPKLLQDLGWTEDELKEFLQYWKEMKNAARAFGRDDPRTKEYQEKLLDMGLWETPPEGRMRHAARSDEYRSQSDIGTVRRFHPPQNYRERFKSYTERISRP